MKKIRIIGIILTLMAVSHLAEAKKTNFLYYGHKLLKQTEVDGKIASKSYCKNQIDYKKYGIVMTPEEESFGDDNVYVSPNEKYFLFAGAESSWSRVHFLLVDISQCKIVKEFETGYPYKYKKLQPAALEAAVFSRDSKKLFITWLIDNSPSLGDIKKMPGVTPKNIDAVIANNRSFINFTKEYSRNNFENERILKNMPVLGRVHVQGWWIYFYKFSKNGDLLVSPKAHPMPGESHMQYIYDIARDKILASFSEKNLDLNKNKKYFKVDMSKYYIEDMMNIAPKIPDVTKDFLLYNLDTPTGTEMDIYNYNDNKLVSKIINAQKGLGTFSGDGKKVIFSEFPNTTTWKRNVIVYDKSTGSVLGQTVLDEQDDIVDVSSDNTQLIYKRNGIQKTINIR